MGAYEAADLAAALRADLIGQRESFVFETPLSDPIGAKVAELAEAARAVEQPLADPNCACPHRSGWVKNGEDVKARRATAGGGLLRAESPAA